MQKLADHVEIHANEQKSDHNAGEEFPVFVLDWSFKGVYCNEVGVDEPCSRLLEHHVDVGVVLRRHVVGVERQNDSPRARTHVLTRKEVGNHSF